MVLWPQQENGHSVHSVPSQPVVELDVVPKPPAVLQQAEPSAGQGIAQLLVPAVNRDPSTVVAVPQVKENVRDGTGGTSVGLGQKRALEEVS